VKLACVRSAEKERARASAGMNAAFSQIMRDKGELAVCAGADQERENANTEARERLTQYTLFR
jgi:hypothetical protein